jgi:hypothetical protein
MKEVVAELNPVTVTVHPGWSIQPVFWVHRNKPDMTPQVVIHVFHNNCVSNRATKAQYCGLTNRKEFLAGAMPTYECNKCAEKVPTNVVEEKLLAQGVYKGYDPRNNRRAAVLAQKNRGT